MGTKLTKALGLERSVPMPPKFEPKLRLRVENDRTRQVSEIAFDIPLEGHLSDMFPVVEKLRRVLEIHGLMPDRNGETKT